VKAFVVALAVSTLVSCEDGECVDARPGFSLVIELGGDLDPEDVESLSVQLELGEASYERTYDVGQELADRSTSLAVELDELDGDSDFEVELTLAAYDSPGAMGDIVAAERGTFIGKPDGCNEFSIRLGSDKPAPDAAFDGGPGPDCGDGDVHPSEDCDDGNFTDDDGCTDCEIDEGFLCDGEPSICAVPCGDGSIDGDETCDDGNGNGGDGCSVQCAQERGFRCTQRCVSVCGDGLLNGEACDDGNNVHDGAVELRRHLR
jgi:cysteine-rich repeat protein